MPTRQAPRVSPGCCRHQVTSSPQPTRLPTPRPGGTRPTPWHLSGETGFSAPKQIQFARAVCQGAGGASTKFPLLICTLQLGAGAGGLPPRVWGFSPPLLPCKKKKKHKNPGSFLNQPSGVPQREEEREKLRDTERQKRETDDVEKEGQKETGKGRDGQRQSGWEEEENWADKERRRTAGQTEDAVHSL